MVAAASLLVLSTAQVQVYSLSYDYGGYPVNNYYQPSAPIVPLAILAESPYSVAKSSVNVPLLIVPQTTLRMINNPHIKAISPTKPLVTCQTPQYLTVSSLFLTKILSFI